MWTAEGERLPELLVLFRLGLRVAIQQESWAARCRLSRVVVCSQKKCKLFLRRDWSCPDAATDVTGCILALGLFQEQNRRPENRIVLTVSLSTEIIPSDPQVEGKNMSLDPFNGIRFALNVLHSRRSRSWRLLQRQ